MYPQSHLDTPPPQSQFRRPWSPEPFDPNPHSARNNDYNPWESLEMHRSRREASDVSVQALDLADFAMTLRPPATASRYPHFRGNEPYPPSSPQMRPILSGESLVTPSLVSAASMSHTASSSRSTRHRPFSLPTLDLSRPSLNDDPSSISRLLNYPYIAAPPSVQGHQLNGGVNSEIDISQFPAWSRNWYNNNGPEPHMTHYDDSTSSHQGHFSSPPKLSPFDPTYTPYPHLGGPHSSNAYPMSNESSRNMLPWSNEPPLISPAVDPDVKEERMRMLQHEFGAKIKRKVFGDSDDDDKDPFAIGSVDDKGKLVTQGPRKRVMIRLLQGLLALGAGASAIYGAVIIKPIGVPPPSGKVPAYLLYILSCITFLAMLYIFVVKPCCCSSARSSQSNLSGGTGGMPGMPGMMVLPVRGGGKGKKGKKGKKGMMPPGDVHVNLIVDPGMLQGQDARQGEEYDEYNDSYSVPGTYSPYAASPTPQRRTRPRQSVFAGLAMEEQWRVARSALKKVAIFDVVFFILWGAEFILILIGKRCPSGAFEGWCNAYNIASAGACLVCITFGTHIFFDVKDLNASKVSPRNRP